MNCGNHLIRQIFNGTATHRKYRLLAPVRVSNHCWDTRVRASADRTISMSRARPYSPSNALIVSTRLRDKHLTRSLGLQTDVSAEGIQYTVINSHVISSHVQYIQSQRKRRVDPCITASTSAILIWEEESLDLSQLAYSTT